MDEKRAKILIVDDNLKNIQVLGTILKEANYSVGFSTDGLQAVNLLKKKNDYELILLDVNMPVMNGYDTCRIIRNELFLTEIPIIFLTAHSEVENIIEGFEAGAQDYVRKPFNARELLVRVNTHLQLKYKNDEIKKMNQTLELKVAERTAELVSANKKLSMMDKAKSDLLTLLSHELRTPLTGIMGFAKLLSDSVNDEEQKLFVDYLLDSADRLLRFSETALLITSLKFKTYKFEFQQHNLTFLVDEVVNTFSKEIEEKKLAIIKNLVDSNISVSADMDLISIAFKNILDNAIKASPKNSTIIITVDVFDGNVLIKIKDEGTGFKEEAMSQLFELFSTTDILHHFEGLGLGLASVKLIMDIHKGKTDVKNSENGAEVSMSIPMLYNE